MPASAATSATSTGTSDGRTSGVADAVNTGAVPSTRTTVVVVGPPGVEAATSNTPSCSKRRTGLAGCPFTVTSTVVPGEKGATVIWTGPVYQPDAASSSPLTSIVGGPTSTERW